MRIKILAPLLANQIAAGEVVERPASVVKELVENSLDAQAKQISIEIKQGGKELIRVRDDGQGIVNDDLSIALARHATSKIAALTDLENVLSLGFRGEALASVSAVARLTLASRHYQAEQGWRVLAEGSHQTAPEPVAHPVGTTVEVSDLFYNTPARRKFLRQPATEFDHIETVIHKLALSQFDVGFRLSHNQKLIFSANAALTEIQREQRVAAVLGQDFMKQAIRVEFIAGLWQLQGWLGLPDFNRSQADMQYWYLNGRYVRDKLLSHAVREAYQDVLFNNRHPAYVLYLTGDANQVDVNVHPTKHEVRFRDARSVHQFIVHTLREALAQIRPAPAKSPSMSEIPTAIPDQREHQEAPSSARPWAKMAEKNFVTSQQQALSFQIQEPQQTYVVAEKNPSLGTALAQLNNTYLLAQNEQGLIIVDIHAAHERIQYEKMKQEQPSTLSSVQPLLIPITVNLNRQELTIWEKHHTELADSGLVTEALGPETILVRAIPVLLQKADIAQIVRDVLADLAVQTSSARLPNLINEILGNIACRRAIRANHPLTLVEMDALLRLMEQTPNSGYCNHGRPTWKQITWAEIDKFFLRGR